MGEREERLGRMFGYSRGRWALLTGAGAVLVALLMVGSSGASAAGAALTVKPAYKGLVEPENSISTSGCSTKATLKHFKFSLHTGDFTGAAAGKAGSCGKKAPKGFNNYSDIYADGGVSPALVKLPKIPATTSNISANLAGKYTLSISASDGGSATCNSGLTTSMYSFTEWEWGYNGLYFTGFAYNESDFYDGTWYNYSYNTASIPSPFNLNNTTYYYHYSDGSTYGYCEADSGVFYNLYGYLYDAKTGYSTFYSGSNAPEFGDTYIGVYNETDYGWYNYTEWYGPSNFTYGYPTTYYNYNTTLTSYVDSYTYSVTGGYVFSYTTGANNTQTASNSTSLSGDSMWWTGTFSSTDQYYLELYLYFDGSAYNNNWAKGSASFSLNVLTAGNGIKLSSITLS